MQTHYPIDSLCIYLALWAFAVVTPGLDPSWDSDLPAKPYSACPWKMGKGHPGNHHKLGLHPKVGSNALNLFLTRFVLPKHILTFGYLIAHRAGNHINSFQIRYECLMMVSHSLSSGYNLTGAYSALS